jgi:hypothetical protein
MMSTWCSKHVQAWNKLIVKFCASSWLITKINVLPCVCVCVCVCVYIYTYMCVCVCVCLFWVLSSLDTNVYFEVHFWSSALRRSQGAEKCAMWTKLIVSVTCQPDLWSRQFTPQRVLLLEIRLTLPLIQTQQIFVSPSTSVQTCIRVPSLLATEFFQQSEVGIRGVHDL